VNLTAASKNIPYTTDQVNYTVAATDTAIGTADVSGIAQETMPSIVSITSTTQGEGTYDLFGQYYEGEDTTSAGTGFIVGKNDSELLIATNNHVVSDAKAISVQFFDDEVYDATTKGNDSSADLAVIAVKLKDMKDSTLDSIRIATLGDSSECKVGEMVVAIGNALGYGQSVTVGYVSAKDREITEESDDSSSSSSQGSTIKVIQTDAAINPGNSGGPLINMQGEVIGINSAKIAASSVEGVGYSIPISEATPIIDELMNREVLTDSQKGYLGISGKTVTQEASNFNVPEGVYVAEVAEGGAADKAGIKMGDIITAINDIQVTTIESLKEKANSYKKGTKITITLQRSDNGTYKEKNVEVTLQGESSLNKLEDSSGSTNSDSSNDNSGQGNGGSGQDGSNGNSGSNGDSGSGQDGSGDDSQDGGSSFGNWGSLFPFGN
jgi:serine protease Do